MILTMPWRMGGAVPSWWCLSHGWGTLKTRKCTCAPAAASAASRGPHVCPDARIASSFASRAGPVPLESQGVEQGPAVSGRASVDQPNESVNRGQLWVTAWFLSPPPGSRHQRLSGHCHPAFFTFPPPVASSTDVPHVCRLCGTPEIQDGLAFLVLGCSCFSNIRAFLSQA